MPGIELNLSAFTFMIFRCIKTKVKVKSFLTSQMADPEISG
jgi:hypothetical protein